MFDSRDWHLSLGQYCLSMLPMGHRFHFEAWHLCLRQKTDKKFPFFNHIEPGWLPMCSIFRPNPSNGQTLENRQRNNKVISIVREAVKLKKVSFLLTFLNPSPLLCLLTFCSINIYLEPKFPLGMVQPGTVLSLPPPLESAKLSL